MSLLFPLPFRGGNRIRGITTILITVTTVSSCIYLLYLKNKELLNENQVNEMNVLKDELIKAIFPKGFTSLFLTLQGKGMRIGKELKDSTNNFTDLFHGIIEEWNNLLHSLTLEQLAILSNTLVAFLVLTCLINIILIIYSDFLITFFKLEERFPKLAKFIQLRRKFQRFYMSLFFSISIIALIIVIYLNIRTFYLL